MTKITGRRLIMYGAMLSGGVVALAVAGEIAFWLFSLYGMGSFPFVDDFSTRDLSRWPHFAIQKCCEHSVKVADAPDLPGKYAARFEIMYGDSSVRGKTRTEFRMKAVQFHKTYEYAAKVYIPKDWKPDNTLVLIMQMHNVPEHFSSPGDFAPPLAINIIGDQWVVIGAHGIKPTWFDAKGNFHVKQLWTAPLETGKWVSWVIRVRWSTGDDGFIDIDKDGTPAVRLKGANSYDDLVAPYFKFGVYAPEWAHLPKPPEVTQRTAYFTDVSAREVGK